MSMLTNLSDNNKKQLLIFSAASATIAGALYVLKRTSTARTINHAERTSSITSPSPDELKKQAALIQALESKVQELTAKVDSLMSPSLVLLCPVFHSIYNIIVFHVI